MTDGTRTLGHGHATTDRPGGTSGASRIRVLNADRQVELGDRIRVADSVWSRLRGLLGHPEPEPGEGLLIDPSRGVHMFGMSYPLDVLILDADRRVLACYASLPPGGRSAMLRDGRYALELPVGTIQATDTRVGHLLQWEDTP